MNGLNIGANAQPPSQIIRATHALHTAASSGDPEVAQAWLHAALQQMGEAGEESWMPSPELACQMGSDRERRRPVISETHEMSAPVPLSPGDGIVATILTSLFSSAEQRRFFYADGALKSSVEKRLLAGLAFQWDVTLTSVRVPHAGNATPAANIPAANSELRIFTDKELAPILRALNRCTVQIFRTSSSEPGLDDTQLAYYGEDGKLIPRSLLPYAFFGEKEAKIQISNPSAYADVVVPAVFANTTQAPLFVDAALTVHGLFVDEALIPPSMQKRIGQAKK